MKTKCCVNQPHFTIPENSKFLPNKQDLSNKSWCGAYKILIQSLLYQSFPSKKSQLDFLYFSRHQDQNFPSLVLCHSNGDLGVLSYNTDGGIFFVKNS